ncbi:hypothetical protein TSUD_252620 [Trifolium subterraneum]|nr:hypothetical protein TSUD_252620 [Trifolium subterraneum]
MLLRRALWHYRRYAMKWHQEKTNQVLKDELKQCSRSKRKIYDYNHIKDKVMRIKLELSIREETALMVKAEKKVVFTLVEL